ncbi:unnamed protein product, partial [marine sediment metagenome]
AFYEEVDGFLKKVLPNIKYKLSLVFHGDKQRLLEAEFVFNIGQHPLEKILI